MEPVYHRELNPHAPKLNDTLEGKDTMTYCMLSVNNFTLYRYYNSPR